MVSGREVPTCDSTHLSQLYSAAVLLRPDSITLTNHITGLQRQFWVKYFIPLNFPLSLQRQGTTLRQQSLLLKCYEWSLPFIKLSFETKRQLADSCPTHAQEGCVSSSRHRSRRTRYPSHSKLWRVCSAGSSVVQTQKHRRQMAPPFLIIFV